jgi:phosphotriesterase-related protein
MMVQLITTLGKFSLGELGMILPHEHIYVDMQALERPDDFYVNPDDVVALMAPEIEKAKAAGVSALVECTPIGVGRRCDFVRAVSTHTGFPIIVPTGLYRDAWMPQWARDASIEYLADWMQGELRNGISDCGVQAAWIKLGATDDGLRADETKALRAAAQAGSQTNAVIGSHTVSGKIALQQMDIIESEGYTSRRFIWIHAQMEHDWDLVLEAAQRGAWIELDGIGSDPEGDAYYVKRIMDALDAGFGDQLLLSHDRGWYDPSQPGGGKPRDYIYISTTFLPKLSAAGVTSEVIRNLTHKNPFLAFAR